MKTTKKLLLAAVTVATVASVSSAQKFYDDDIYFNPSKDKDKNIEQAKKLAEQQKANAIIYYPVADYPAADTYTVETSSKRSVDEYNRRGIFSTAMPVNSDSLSTDDFENTRKIEKYYNPSIVSGSSDNDLVQLYYAEPANVNIYLNAPGYWGYPYYSSYWALSSLYWGWYDPWYWGPSWSWGWPSWSWSWGWGPSWSWGWRPGWSPSWGWGGPGWGPSWGWGGPGWGPGPVWGGGPSYNNPRHPGAGRQPSYGSAGNRLPSYGGSMTTPGRNTYGRPAMSGGNTNTRPGGTTNPGTYRPSNTNTNTNYDSYTRPGRNNSTPTYRNNSGSTSGGGRSSGGISTGGGSRSTGGGGGGRGRH